MALNKVRT
jgi:hypothetical protein